MFEPLFSQRLTTVAVLRSGPLETCPSDVTKMRPKGGSQMSKANYRKSIEVTSHASAAFDAVTLGVEHWWTKPDQPLRKIGDRAKFGFPPGRSYWTFELVDAVRPHRVVWHCVDALHIHQGQPKEIETEWLGTTLEWGIVETGNCTIVTFEHCGLTPQLLCYDVCETGWDIFFLGSLKAYLDTGKGAPHQVS
ncbi:MAG: SRPBCC domain-containing protein [Pseudomonadota bacterium]